jgi:hypothetical protein
MERCESEFCGKTFEKASERMAVKMANALRIPRDKMLEGFRSKKARETLKKECMKGYCNPECKNTVFQSGKNAPEALYTSFQEKTKLNKTMAKSAVNTLRKKVFGKRTNVLKNSFYNRLTAKNVTRARKQGALSGCTLKILT